MSTAAWDFVWLDANLQPNLPVQATVPADKLLVYQPGDGWEPLCEFLGKPMPDEEYPRVNSTEQFQEQWKKISAEANDRNKLQ